MRVPSESSLGDDIENPKSANSWGTKRKGIWLMSLSFVGFTKSLQRYHLCAFVLSESHNSKF